MDLTDVRPAAPVAPWLGGKRRLHPIIIERLRTIPHLTYAEPFVGMGGVFLRRPFRPRLEVANDLNGEITNLFRILQRHHQQLMDVMRWQIASRHEFDRLRAVEPAYLTDLERAARFLYLQKLAYGGQIDGVFGVSPGRTRWSLSRLEPILEAAHERLDGVVLEALDWRELIRRYDRPETLFYLDPPYWGNERDYGRSMFSRADFEEMADVLSALRGRFVLSLNDRPEVRQTFGAFAMEPVTVSYSIARSGGTRAGELIITSG